MKGTVIVTSARSGRTSVGALAEGLDRREDVVPAAGVQAVGVLAQLPQHLLHLEGGGQGLDQDRGAEGATVEAERLLGEGEDLVPESRLQMVLELRQVEVGAAAVRRRAGAPQWKAKRPKSISEPEPAVPSKSMWRSGRWRPRGRTRSVAVCSPSA